MNATMRAYELKLLPDRVNALREASRRLSYYQQTDVTWQQLVRRGIDMVLAAEGEPVPASGENNDIKKMEAM